MSTKSKTIRIPTEICDKIEHLPGSFSSNVTEALQNQYITNEYISYALSNQDIPSNQFPPTPIAYIGSVEKVIIYLFNPNLLKLLLLLRYRKSVKIGFNKNCYFCKIFNYKCKLMG